MKRNYFAVICLLLLASVLTGCGNTAQTDGGYRGIDVASPDWVGQLDAAGDTDRTQPKERNKC